MRYAALLILAISLPALAQTVPAPRTEIEVGAAHETLSKGLPDWRSRYLLLEHRGPERRVFYGGWRDTERYRLRDEEVHGGAWLPLSPALQVQIEASASGSHRVLARNSGLLGVQFEPASGWGLAAGWRRSHYDAGNTRVIHLGAERYVGNERFAYTLYAGGPDGAATASSQRLQWNHYYGERDWIGISIADGRETEHGGAGSFLTSRVSNLTLTGRHQLARAWSLAWEAGRQRQGDLYTRDGLRLGLRHEF
ncbi:MAG: YaiO family outer membrane beta-barrel protein [Rhodocyclales bacterium]|nr:YaiO family outer membrane beta-barrel protein [Rhodocyclales bacterium]